MKNAMSADKLLKEKLVNPERIETGKISGDGLVIGINKMTPIYGREYFEQMIKKPEYFLWPLLTLGMFQKWILEKLLFDNLTTPMI